MPPTPSPSMSPVPDPSFWHSVLSADLSGLGPIATVIAAVIAIIGVLATRAQAKRSADAAHRSVEANERIADQVGKRATADAFAKRYQDAAAQLGHEKAPVRLAGVYAMARLADDWEDQRQSCVDVLCAYVRMPVPKVKVDGQVVDDRGDLQVRETIWSVIRDHVGPNAGGHSWQDREFDFNGAVIRNLRLEHVTFLKPVRFRHARLQGTAELAYVKFAEGASFDDCQVEESLTISNIVGRAEPVTFKRTHVGKDAIVRFRTNSHDSADEDQAPNFEAMNVKGTLEIALVKGKTVQAPIYMNRVHMWENSTVKIIPTVNLSKDPEVKHFQGIWAADWTFEEPCTLDIPQGLIDTRTVRFATNGRVIPDGVSMTFQLAWGRTDQQPD